MYIVSLLLFQFYYSSEAVWTQYWFGSSNCNASTSSFVESIPDGYCASGSILSCSGNTVFTQTYGNVNCTGAPAFTTNTTSGKCNIFGGSSSTQNCGPLPYSAYLAISSYSNSNCQGTQPQIIEQLNICQKSGNTSSLLSCTSNGLIVQKVWNATSCSGQLLGATYQPTYSCLSSGSISSQKAICSGSLASPIPYGTISLKIYSSGCQANATTSIIYATNLCQTASYQSSYYMTCAGNSATFKSYLTADCSGSVNSTTTTALNNCTVFFGANIVATACGSSGSILHANVILFCLFYFFSPISQNFLVGKGK